MAWIMPLIPIGFGAAKMYQNLQPDARQANSHEKRKDAIVERLTAGHNPRVAQLTEKQFEKFIRTNSVGKHAEGQLRSVRESCLAPNLAVLVPNPDIGA